MPSNIVGVKRRLILQSLVHQQTQREPNDSYRKPVAETSNDRNGIRVLRRVLIL